jgi:acyl carrier protein
LNKREFLLLLDELLELDPGTLQGPESLTEVESWDSLAVVSFMGLAKTKAGKTVAPKQVAVCKTVDDLYSLVSAGR